jgi:succinate dehydrogenase/fumarate reductase flavoprotein subunit
MNSLESAEHHTVCDVLVIGCGASGSVAAITAHDMGADVIILEKMPTTGGNCLVSGGNICTPTDIKFAKYLDILGFDTTDSELNEVFVNGAMKNVDWIRKMGGEVTPFKTPPFKIFPGLDEGPGWPHLPGSKYMIKYNIKKEDGEKDSAGSRLWKLLKRNVENRKIRVIKNTAAKDIMKNENGEVVGVLAEKGSEKIFFQSRKAVILATGSFENNEALKWEYLIPKPIKFLGSPGNKGDGVRLAQKVGADLWHMTAKGCTIGFQSPEFEAAFNIAFLNEGFFFVDKNGKRFMAEVGLEIHDFARFFAYFDSKNVEYPRVPSWALFDDETRRSGPLYSDVVGYNRLSYQWSPDNLLEISKGWIIKAENLKELSNKIAVNKSVLQNTLNRYNKFCKNGNDKDFDRTKETLRAIEGPPYYAIEIWPTLYACHGGPRRNKEAKVLDPYGMAIPRLYSVGEGGSIMGFLAHGGVSLSDCIVFGQIAGRNAAAEKNLL